ncbi:hypothetical protein PRUPE_6G066000 [Prunus persica]|uniref:Uncharacterized protein n=1 Tax=Prunus persica TaxID=3760 RepID=A0A251NL60_PRUPE|nr:hypothetical protein PRUPE_6G066000 [Prunus persica]
MALVRPCLGNSHTQNPFSNGNSHTQNPILHCSLNLLYLRILWKLKPPQELAAAALHSLPFVVLVHLLYIPLSNDLKCRPRAPPSPLLSSAPEGLP